MDVNANEKGRAALPPLPIEIPKPPDLSSIPYHVLHSGTVETLIGQSEDLMARLKVNVRRNSLLEQQINEQERIASELTRVNATLTSQLQVFQEKDRMFRDKAMRESDQTETLKREIETLRARLTIAEGMRSAVRYVRRVRLWVRPLLERLSEDLEREKKARMSREAQVSDLRARLAEVVVHSQGLERQFTRDQTKLIDQYEAAQRKMEAQLEKLMNETRALREKAARMDELNVAKTEIENRVIFLERQNFDLESQMTAFRKEAKTLTLEAAHRDKDLQDRREECERLKDANARLQDQFESLQAVWADSQKRLEASKLQQETLNRLNQELSRQLKAQRIARIDGAEDLGPQEGPTA